MHGLTTKSLLSKMFSSKSIKSLKSFGVNKIQDLKLANNGLDFHCIGADADERDWLEIGSVNTERPTRNCSDVYELIPGKLCFAFHDSQDFSRAEIKRRPDLFFFSTDLHERYIPFCKDFGPVNLGIMYRFWQYVRAKEHHPFLRGRPLVYYTDLDDGHQANSAVLLGAYMMLEHNMTAADVSKEFQKLPQYPFISFRDATFSAADFGVTLEDCLGGLERAMQVCWFDPATFDVKQYEDLEDPDGGDMSLIGDKFVAFRGPKLGPDEEDCWACSPSFYFDAFKKAGVTDVIRLNEATCYDGDAFRNEGFQMHDLEFADCTCPSPAQIKRFLDIVDKAKGKVAVHCKAGLGRTGTMIALWMMKHPGFSAREAIAWLRLCRPGSVIGQQQHFLAACEGMRWDGNTIIPLPTSRRSSASASGASTPVTSAASAINAAEMGRFIEHASRARAQAKKSAM